MFLCYFIYFIINFFISKKTLIVGNYIKAIGFKFNIRYFQYWKSMNAYKRPLATMTYQSSTILLPVTYAVSITHP